MLSKIKKYVLVLVFGKKSLNGYYVPEIQPILKKKYVYSSVFPSRTIMEQVLNLDSSVVD